MWTYFGATLGAAVVGIGAVVYIVPDSHRHTLYKNSFKGAKDVTMNLFSSEIKSSTLDTTKDEYRIDWFITIHLSYYEPKPVLDWLLALETDNEIFTDDTKLRPLEGTARRMIRRSTRFSRRSSSTARLTGS